MKKGMLYDVNDAVKALNRVEALNPKTISEKKRPKMVFLFISIQSIVCCGSD